jgi:hypothetical protein
VGRHRQRTGRLTLTVLGGLAKIDRSLLIYYADDMGRSLIAKSE